MYSENRNSVSHSPILNTAQKYELFFELASILGNQIDFREILRLISVKTALVFSADLVSVVMINPKTQDTLKTIIQEDKKNKFDKKSYQLIQTNVIGWMMKTHLSFVCESIKTDNRFSKGLFKDSSFGSVLAAPLISEKMAVGYCILMNKETSRVFNKENQLLLEKLSCIISLFLSNSPEIIDYFHSSLQPETLVLKYKSLGLIGKSPSFIELLRAVEGAVNNDVRVILEGESGTGKEVIARAIHKLSNRNDKPFVAVDCGAIPENLMESELFGHQKGSFTGASYARKGLFEEADKGILFMDEISNLPLEMQSKLLRVLQEGEIRIVGSNRPIKVNVRIIAASSPSLKKMVAQQKFREDLYYRLHVYPIYVPSLKERSADIPALSHYFMKKMAVKHHKVTCSFDRNILTFMKNRSWEGNIRELENFVERLVTLAQTDTMSIDYHLLPQEFKAEFSSILNHHLQFSKEESLEEKLNTYEMDLLKKTLEENNWNQSRAARALKISERVIRYKMEKYNIQKE